MGKLKELIIIGLVAVLSFPLLYVGMLFMNGMLRIEYGVPRQDVEQGKKLETIKRTEKTDSLMLAHSRTFQALQIEKTELEKERQRLSEMQERMDILQKDLEEKKKALADERVKMEALVKKSDTLEAKKYKSQAKIYEAMKPLEAAQIIETLPDDAAAKILNAMSDNRQKGKILALLSPEKASRISDMLGN